MLSLLLLLLLCRLYTLYVYWCKIITSKLPNSIDFSCLRKFYAHPFGHISHVNHDPIEPLISLSSSRVKVFFCVFFYGFFVSVRRSFLINLCKIEKSVCERQRAKEGRKRNLFYCYLSFVIVIFIFVDKHFYSVFVRF